MKLTSIATASVLMLGSLAFISCKQEKGPAEKVGNKVDDALNQRPGEKARDAAEKVGDKVNDALDQRPGEKLRDAAEELTK